MWAKRSKERGLGWVERGKGWGVVGGDSNEKGKVTVVRLVVGGDSNKKGKVTVVRWLKRNMFTCS